MQARWVVRMDLPWGGRGKGVEKGGMACGIWPRRCHAVGDCKACLSLACRLALCLEYEKSQLESVPESWK